MVKAKKKVSAPAKVVTKSPVKPSAANKVLKKVSFGAGVLVRKVRKAGKVVSPKIWQDAQKSILSVLKLSSKPKPAAAVPVVKAEAKKKKKKVSKKTVRKTVQKTA